MLYKANVLMYDTQTESLWSQVKRQAVTGPLTGEKLRVLPSTLTTWKKWLAIYPQSQVLSPDTGYQRDYTQDPYADYYIREKGFLALFKADLGAEEKALVVGISSGAKSKAYPLELVRRQGQITDIFDERTLIVSLSPENDQISVRTSEGDVLAPLILYWFVWKSIYPESGLYHE